MTGSKQLSDDFNVTWTFSGVLSLASSVAFLIIGFLNLLSVLSFNISFILLFAVIYSFARVSKEEWTLAIYPIVFSLLPFRSIIGISFPILWIFGVIFAKLFSLKREALTECFKNINWGLFSMLCLGLFLSLINSSYGLHSEIGGSVLGSITYFINIIGIFMAGPLFFSLVVQKEKRRVSLITLTIIAALSFYLLILAFGKPEMLQIDSATGFGVVYNFFGWQFSLVRTQLVILLSVCAASLFALISKPRSIKSQSLYIILFSACVIVMLWSGSRGGTLFLISTIIFFLFIKGGKRRLSLKSTAAYFIVVAILFGVASFFGNISNLIFESRWSPLLQAGLKYEARPLIWMDAVRQIAREPFGIGWSQSFLESTQIISSNAHNDYLVFGISYGIIGGIAYLLVVINSILIGFKKMRSQTEELLGSIAFCAALCLSLNLMTDHLAVDFTRYYLCWIIISIGIAPYLDFSHKNTTETIPNEQKH